jgi:NAD(P)-dependent dehydrogenase (short-subunit alcohol dehydrogenase family)
MMADSTDSRSAERSISAPALRLAGRRVLVTGAASGIGKATAIRVADDGADVALVDLHDADAVAGRCRGAGGRAEVFGCDVSDPAAVAATVESAASWLGGLDAVLHVAGIVGDRDSRVDDLAVGDWDSVIGVNLNGAFHVAKSVVPHLERTSGVLVLTGSGAGIWNGHASVAYGASKGGLHGLALTLEGPLRERGIRVFDVAPGAVDTPLLRRVAGGRPTKPLVPPERVAAILAFLASDDAAAVRGTIRTW